MLGKGLESLIPQKGGSEPASQPAAVPGAEPARTVQPALPALPAQQPVRQPEKEPQSIFHIEVEKIRANPNQPRRDFNQEAIHELASSIREFGLLQPLVVTKVEKETPSGIDVEYELIAGERRLLASKMLGLRVVPAIIRNVGLEREKLELAVIENIQRENLNPVETARAFQRLQEEFHLTQREIASKLGKSREAVANSVRLLDLPPYIQEALQKGELSESHGRLLLAVEDPAAQKKLFDDITRYRLTTRDVRDRVERIRRPYGEREEVELPPEVKALKDSLSISLGAPVEIKKGAASGRISITFYSPEELENILRRLGRENF
ncbi:MAG TPA: ParB/RepB/Spo0J family partition protein [Candidatus Paceibacterota bacterium]|nr:ParB/RepB/Spo0J family partition protein [Candidatus Paceibacterota bacterium]